MSKLIKYKRGALIPSKMLADTISYLNSMNHTITEADCLQALYDYAEERDPFKMYKEEDFFNWVLERSEVVEYVEL